jgi:Na+/phosphate symporter
VIKRSAAWVGAAALLLFYVWLPAGDEGLPDLEGTKREADAPRLEITDVLPHDAAAGSAVVVSYAGALPEEPALPAHVWSGKTPLHVLAQRAGSVVVELPEELHDDRIKLRVVVGNERSKSYELRIKSVDWRKPFRNLCGGFVLLLLGVSRLSRAARSLSGSSTWRWTKGGVWQLAAVGAGGLLGGLMHSATATAGVLAGAVSSRVLALQPAAAVFLGAQLGAAAAPFLLASASEPHEGLIAVAIGGLCLKLAADRRGRALAWLLLSGGVVAFALQVLRPGFEPIVSNPTLLGVLGQLSADGFAGAAGLVALGTLLVVLFQGPAPVLVLALIAGQMLGHTEPRATLLLLSGAGLGSALSALLTTPFAPQGRRFAELNLLMGLCGTLLTAASVGLFDALGQRLAGGAWAIYFGKHVLPGGAWRVAVAFALSQLTVTLVLLPLIPVFVRLLDWSAGLRVTTPGQLAGDAPASMRSQLVAALGAQVRALPALLQLSVAAERSAGREAEHCLTEADTALECVFAYSDSDPEIALRGTALAELQLQRALERVLHEAERLTDERIGWGEDGAAVATLSEAELRVLSALYELIAEGLKSVQDSLSSGVQPDPDLTRAREIQINALESQLRIGVSTRAASRSDLSRGLSIITLVDALETAGNQLYRLAEACAVSARQETAVNPVSVPPLSAATRGGPC